MNENRRVRVDWLGEYRTRIDVRGTHQIQGDETPEYGGEDTGPMPTELLLAALGSCMCLAVAHVARKRRMALATLSVEVSGDKDLHAFRFQEIALLVRADLPQDQLVPLVEQARRYCFVSNTLSAGCSIQYTAESTAGADSPGGGPQDHTEGGDAVARAAERKAPALDVARATTRVAPTASAGRAEEPDPPSQARPGVGT